MERDFKGVWIPKEIYLNKDLNWAEKILLIEIGSLDRDGRGCFASNKHLSVFLMMSEGSVANMIVKLTKMGYLIKKDFDGRKRYISLNSDLTNLLKQSSQIYESSLNKNMNAGFTNMLKQTSQKSEHSNTYSNTVNNTINKENAELKNSSHTQQNQNFENDILQLEPLDDEPVKKRKKVAQKKEKEILKIYPHNFSSEMIRAADEFFEYRKEIKKPLKSEKSINTKMNQWSKEINQYGEKVVIESINSSIANGYQGTFIKLDKNYQNGFNNNNTDTFKEFLRKGSNFEL